jgi:UDP-2,3-diacylglucosamine hydrolase
MTTEALSGKKIYFASDFHLGVPDYESSLIREKRIVAWLDSIRHDAHSIYLLGDLFDFWFEYKYTVPKGYIRLLGKIADLKDSGIPIVFFTGNHDLWMNDYFPKELGIPVYNDPQEITVGSQKLLIGHGDGLGPGDTTYKLLKRYFFSNRFAQWLFAWLHPNIGMRLANAWSKQSRIANIKKEEQKFYGEEGEFLFAYCKELEKTNHHDFYIFGHRHLPLTMKVADNSTYINLGEWVNFNTYAEYDGMKVELKTFIASPK